MALVIKDRVLETSATTGIGTLSLGGTKTGFQGFVNAVGSGNTTYYTIEDGLKWETGLGTVTAGSPDTLSRDVVEDSSDGGAKVDWGSGVRNVFCAVPASKIALNP